MAIKVGMISLGCAKNLVDAEIMLGSVLERGMEITSVAEDADVLVVPVGGGGLASGVAMVRVRGAASASCHAPIGSMNRLPKSTVQAVVRRREWRRRTDAPNAT